MLIKHTDGSVDPLKAETSRFLNAVHTECLGLELIRGDWVVVGGEKTWSLVFMELIP